MIKFNNKINKNYIFIKVLTNKKTLYKIYNHKFGIFKLIYKGNKLSMKNRRI